MFYITEACFKSNLSLWVPEYQSMQVYTCSLCKSAEPTSAHLRLAGLPASLTTCLMHARLTPQAQQILTKFWRATHASKF